MKVAFTPRPSAAPVPPVASPPAGPDPDQVAADAMLKAAFEGGPDDPPPVPLTEKPPEPVPPVPPDDKKEPDKKEPDKKEEEKKPEAPESIIDELDKPPEGVVLPKQTSKDLRSALERANAALKEREGEKKLQEEELTSLRKELEDLKAKSSQVEVPEKIDYTGDPAVTKYTHPIIKDLTATARTIGGKEGKILNERFEKGYFPEFVRANAKKGIEGDEAVDALRAKLDEELGEQGGRDAMALLNRSLPGYEQAVAELHRLEADSHNHRGRQTVEKYATVEKELKTVLEPLGELPDEAIIAKPHAPESFVSKLISSDPKWLVRSQQVKKEIQEIFAGVKPLSPEDRAKLEANDTGGLSQLEETRNKQFTEKRAAMMKRLYLAMMILPNFPTMFSELENLRAGQMDDEKELDALEKVPEAKAPPKSNGAPVERDLKKDLQDVFAGRFKETE